MYILPDLIISVKHLLMCEQSVIMNCLYDYTFTYLTLIKKTLGKNDSCFF